MTEIGGDDDTGPGTTKLAKDFNQLLARNARRAIFHHPDDQPLEGIELPEPREREIYVDHPAGLPPPGPADAPNTAHQE
jgi:hypothetical protein